MSPIITIANENTYVFAEWKDLDPTVIYTPAPAYVYSGRSLSKWTITPDQAAAVAGNIDAAAEDADDLAASRAAKADGTVIPYSQVRAKLGLT